MPAQSLLASTPRQNGRTPRQNRRDKQDPERLRTVAQPGSAARVLAIAAKPPLGQRADPEEAASDAGLGGALAGVLR